MFQLMIPKTDHSDSHRQLDGTIKVFEKCSKIESNLFESDIQIIKRGARWHIG